MAEWFRALKHRLRVRRAIAEIEARSPALQPHGLPFPLIVSLTSYPARFPVLALTLKGLLRQEVRPDRTLLWIARDDMDALPAGVTALRSEGLEILPTEDLRSYKKIVPALRLAPEAAIVTADDDIPYPGDWLALLVAAAKAHPGRIVSRRAHRLSWTPEGRLAPYALWQKNIGGEAEGPEIFATGVGGILYPPGCLHGDATREELFLRLCPGADDVWLYFMARLAGSVVHHTGPSMRVVEWPDSQGQSLRKTNLGPPGESGNDRAIAALTAHYGPPPRV